MPRLALALVATLAAPCLAQSPSTDVSIGVFPFLVGNMDGRVQEIVDECERHGADTIHVSVFRATGPSRGDLWITDSYGGWNPAWGPVRPGGAGIDLRALIAAAKAKGLRVAGVLKCFADSVQPTDAAHRQYLLDVIGYFVDSYQPNGAPTYDMDIALDYVRFVSSGTGRSHQPVTDFVRDVKLRIAPRELHAYLLANRYTFDGPNYDGNFASYGAVIAGLAAQFGQHWEHMAAWVDVMMPMCYTADGSIYNTYALHQAYVRQAAAYCRTACNLASFPGRRVQPVVKTYSSSGETTTPQTVEASITGALLGGAQGYQSFRYGTTHSTWWPKLQQYAVPGPNFPVPELTASTVGVTVLADATASRDFDEPSQNLQVRFDWNGDGEFDTGWLPNAVVAGVLPAPGKRRIGFAVRDSQGQVATSSREIDAGAVLTLSSPLFGAGAGGSVDVRLDAGSGAAGATYLVLGSLSGTTPGTPWQPGFHVPLNLDGLTEALFLAVNTPVLQAGLGTFDANGRATATLTVPAGVLSGFTFRSLSFAAIAVDGTGAPLFVSNAGALLIMP